MNGPKKSYISMMDAVVKERAAKQRQTHPLRPSAAGSCARRLAHELMAFQGKAPVITEDRKPSVERLLSLGHYVEEQVGNDLKDIPGLAVRFQQQVVDFFTLEDGHRVEGSTDFVMWSADTRGLLDAKTVGDRFHSAFNGKWDSLIETYRRLPALVEFDTEAFWAEDLMALVEQLGTEDSLYKNLVQVNGYACTPFMQSRGIDHGGIIRYNKNNSRLMEIRFKPSLELFRQTEEKFNRIARAVAEGKPELVEKERVPPHIDCAYCPYKQQCWPTTPRSGFFKGDRPWVKKTRELPKQTAEQLESLYQQWQVLTDAEEEKDRLQADLILAMEAAGVDKIELDGGQVYEVKSLKAGPEIRRSKR